VEKAEDDYRVAQREFAAEDQPSFDAACFHAQQCVEKLMKAVLISRQVLAPKTHDLIALSTLLQDIISNWSWSEDELMLLSRCSTMYRYPGESATHEDAAQSLDICMRLRDSLLKLL
jgi:HEPN domain-containing protein